MNNIGDGEFKYAQAHISQDHYETLAKHQIEAGDMVIAMLGETLPRACIIPPDIPPAIVKADCARFSTQRELLQPSYANIVLNAWSTRKRASKLIAGVGRPRLNLTKVRSLPVPLPPFDEQSQIASVVGEIVDAIETADSTIQLKLEQSGVLRQSILKSAFEGKLVSEELVGAT